MVKDMTEGNSAKQILMFTLPLLVRNLFQQFYNMADTIIVGQTLGKGALAAVGATGSFNFLIIGFVLGTASGFCIPVAQYFGAKDYKKMRACVANIIYLGVAISAVLTLLTMLFTKDILRLLDTPSDIIDDSYSYIIVIFAGMSATMFYNILAGLLRALGDSRSPLYFLIISSALNIGMDFFFILVLHAGVMGAGLATVLAQLISGLLCLFYIIKKSQVLHLTREDMKPSFMLSKKLLFLGLPMALQFSITAVGGLILQKSVNGLGSTAVASVSTGNKASMILTQPMESLGIAMATFCGQNLGAGKIDRVRRGVHQAIGMVIIYSIVATVVSFTAGKYMALLFISGNETVVIGGIYRMLSICGCFYSALAILFVYRNSIQGLGFGVPAMAAGLFELAARAAVGSFFVPVYGFDAACIAGPVAWIAADILLIPVFYIVLSRLLKKYGFKKKREERIKPEAE